MGKKNINRKHAIIITSFLFTQFILAIFIAAIISNNSLSKKVQAEEKLRNAYNFQILDAASTKPTEITVDYSKQISTGSPLIFGGSHSPKLEHQDAWDKIADAGVTSVRKDFFPENALPKNITLEDYKNNVNGVPKDWEVYKHMI